MDYERKDNTAALFREEEKQNERGPDYTGMGLIEGKELRLAGWINESKSGKKYLSLKFEEPRSKEDKKPAPAKVDDDDVPF
tara:strand:- start:218 stop:460 length:243 start_codon:yes stop_codon:yes gene_type:complete